MNMVCENCGAELKGKYLFCNKCGTPVPSKEKTEEGTDEFIEECFEEYTEEFTEETPQEAVQELTEDTAEDPAEDIIEEHTENTAEEVTEEVSIDNTEEYVEECSEGVSEETFEDVTEEVIEERTEGAGSRIEALSSRMKKLCDEMTSAYALGMQEIEAAVTSAKDKTDKSRMELQIQLTESKEQNVRLSTEVRRLLEENRQLKEKTDQLMKENQVLHGKLESATMGTKKEPTDMRTKTEAADAPGGRVCPKCKTVMADDMMFCTNCGCRLT